MTASPFSRAVALLAAAVVLVGLGFLVASGLENPALSGARTVGLFALVSSAIATGVALQFRRSALAGSLGFGFLFSALTLAGAYLLGLLTHGDKVIADKSRVGLYSGLAVAAFVAGGIFVAVSRGRPAMSQLSLIRAAGGLPPGLLLTGFVFVFVGGVDLATGTVPFLASNVDAVRFAGAGGIFGKLAIWTIGGLEWAVVAAGVTVFIVRARQRAALALLVAALVILVLTAGRSFLVICAFALVVAWGVTTRVSLARVLLISVVGLLVLGFAGSLRVAHSDPSGIRRAYLREHGLTGVGGLVSLSAATGPYVFGETMQEVPRNVPFQGGRFFLRDFRATVPLHPFGHPMRSDEWVTVAILNRDPDIVGGSPPTLAGGLYVDFGFWGVLLGSAALGVGLTALYRWVLKTGTRAALGLYSYLCAYVALAAYSYISLKPTVLVVASIFLVAHRTELARRRFRAESAPGGGSAALSHRMPMSPAER